MSQETVHVKAILTFHEPAAPARPIGDKAQRDYVATYMDQFTEDLARQGKYDKVIGDDDRFVGFKRKYNYSPPTYDNLIPSITLDFELPTDDAWIDCVSEIRRIIDLLLPEDLSIDGTPEMKLQIVHPNKSAPHAIH